MKKLILAIVLICLNMALFSCSNQEDNEMTLYENRTDLVGSGGEEEQTPPPPPPPVDLENGN
jgi:uncharacterized lipoprotein NlpE involved in copper resistance